MTNIESTNGVGTIEATGPVQDRSETKWAMVVCMATLVTTCIPYVIGYSLANGRHFMWLSYNLDDSCVYLAWMRQAAQGSVRAYNLFTTQAQHGMALNPLFLVMGVVSRCTGLPLLAVYHIARLVFGCTLLAVVWNLIGLVIRDSLSRRLSFLFVCVSAGFGWLPLWWVDGPRPVALGIIPVDAWQPEAITFLSLYLSPLFCAALTLQAAIILLLYRGVLTSQVRFAAYAGICGLILALIHTYDIISLTLVWTSFLLVASIWMVRQGQSIKVKAAWLQAAIAGFITSPGVAYIAYELHTEAVFHQRADVKTLSPTWVVVLLGYGLTALLALCSAYAQVRAGATKPGDAREGADQQPWSSPLAATLILCWSIANLAAAYTPTTFQRKMLQGEHLPVAMLAGVGAAWLLSVISWPVRNQGRMVVGYCIAAMTSLTNVRFMIRDVDNDRINLVQTGTHRPYLLQGEVEALAWIEAHVPRTVAIQPMPWLYLVTDAAGHRHVGPSDVSLACFAPGLTGHSVYCGHWGETPDYGAKLDELVRFNLPSTTADERKELLRKAKVGFLIFSQKDDKDEDADRLAPMFRGQVPLPPYLHLVHGNNDADIYQVDISALSN